MCCTRADVEFYLQVRFAAVFPAPGMETLGPKCGGWEVATLWIISLCSFEIVKLFNKFL